MKTTQDANLNPSLKKEIQTLRGGMLAVAEQSTLPSRFTTENDADSPAIWITDTVTGKRTCVPLFSYRVVREALNDLFA